MGISTRDNGQEPPWVPLADINLGSLEFWSLDDRVRDGAFTTLRREAPTTFFPEFELEGFDSAVAERMEPAMLLSAFIHGIKRLPVSWTPPV
jgi:hypothetical protein